MYICADSCSSSTQCLRRVQILIKLSCDTSIIESPVIATLAGGISKDLPGSLNFSTMSITDCSSTPAISATTPILVGRLTPYKSLPFSVIVLKIAWAISFSRVLNSSKASFACCDNASLILPIAL